MDRVYQKITTRIIAEPDAGRAPWVQPWGPAATKAPLALPMLVHQRPGPAEGVVSLTLEDEGGMANVVVWPTPFEAHRRVILTVSMPLIEGRVQREGEGVHVVASRPEDLSERLARTEEGEPMEKGRREAVIRVRARDFR